MQNWKSTWVKAMKKRLGSRTSLKKAAINLIEKKFGERYRRSPRSEVGSLRSEVRSMKSDGYENESTTVILFRLPISDFGLQTSSRGNIFPVIPMIIQLQHFLYYIPHTGITPIHRRDIFHRCFYFVYGIRRATG